MSTQEEWTGLVLSRVCSKMSQEKLPATFRLTPLTANSADAQPLPPCPTAQGGVLSGAHGPPSRPHHKAGQGQAGPPLEGLLLLCVSISPHSKVASPLFSWLVIFKKQGFPDASAVKNLSAIQEPQDTWV